MSDKIGIVKPRPSIAAATAIPVADTKAVADLIVSVPAYWAVIDIKGNLVDSSYMEAGQITTGAGNIVLLDTLKDLNGVHEDVGAPVLTIDPATQLAVADPIDPIDPIDPVDPVDPVDPIDPIDPKIDPKPDPNPVVDPVASIDPQIKALP